MRRIAAIFVLLLPFALSNGQIVTDYEHISIRDGLSNSFTTGMTADGNGFVWVATEHGLNRIAGPDCTAFTTQNSSIPGNEVFSPVFVPSTNEIWASSKHNGVFVYDITSQEFRSIADSVLLSPNVIDIKPAADGGLWIAHVNGSIQLFHPQTGVYENYDTSHYDKLYPNIKCICDDYRGRLYIGYSDRRLAVLDYRTGEISSFSDDLPGRIIRTICIDHEGRVWIGTNHGLGLFAPASGCFSFFSDYRNNERELLYDNIFCLAESSDHKLWVGADVGGVSIIDLETYRNGAFQFKNYSPANSCLSSENVRAIVEDSFGNMWIGNYSSGIDIQATPSLFHMADLSGNDGKIRTCYGIACDHQSNIWLGAEGELLLLKGHHVIMSVGLQGLLNHQSSIVYLIKEDRKGNLWLGINDDGLLKYDPEKKTLIRIPLPNDQIDVHAIYEDPDGTKWIGTESGLFCYREDTGLFREGWFSNLESASVYSILRDKTGKLWVGTLNDGLWVLDSDGGVICHHIEQTGFPSNSINQIYQDDNGTFWLATYDGLVHIPDVRYPDRFQLFDSTCGLIDNHVRAIIQDSSGHLWISTFSGISYFDERDARFVNYNYTAGIPDGGFVESAAVSPDRNEILFSSPLGVCYFDPDISRHKQFLSPIRITSFSADNGGERGRSLQSMPLDGKPLKLVHNQNSINISFTVSNHSQVKHVEYSYVLHGLNEDWYSLGNRNSVSFRGLSPGQYTFSVKARLYGVESAPEDYGSISFVLSPPFWLSWYAKLFYLALLSFIAVVIWRDYRKKQTEKLNGEKLKFYTSITHELKTPLTLIIGPLEDLSMDKSISDNSRNKIKTIHSCSVNLLKLINQMLDFRKVETHNMTLSVSKGSLRSFLSDIGNKYKDLNINPDVSIHVECGPETGHVYFDPKVLTIIIDNLMSNAIKYTPSGTIKLKYEETEDHALICVEDTGHGIPESAIPHIFKKYYQVNGVFQASGTGIGLALVKYMCDLHDIKVDVHSTLGAGTGFTLTLDKHNTYPFAAHKDLVETENVSIVPATLGTERPETKPTLLIVEDNQDIRKYIADSMRDLYDILECGNGKTGLAVAIQNTPDVIISDVMMPELDGMEMCHKLKNDVRTSHIPIILLTAKDSQEDREEGYRSGADSYLTKPFSSSLLKSRIANLVESRRAFASSVLSMNRLPLQQNDNHAISNANPLDLRFISRLDELIEENLASESLDMAWLSSELCMSYSTFYRKVKGLTTLSPVEYIRKKKLQQCAKLIKQEGYNVSQAAYMTGFHNLGNFREAFKNEFGITPSEYQRNQLQNNVV